MNTNIKINITEIEDNYERLKVAIILQAVEDAKKAKYRGDVFNFFRSKWFKTLSSIDGEVFIIHIKKKLTESQKESKIIYKKGDVKV